LGGLTSPFLRIFWADISKILNFFCSGGCVSRRNSK
jgi:hypothetical protein